MQLIDALFSVARQISDGDINELNKLHEKAKNETVTYHDGMKGWKGYYAKLHKGWLLQLAIVFATPFVTTWLLAKKQQIMNKANNIANGVVDFDEDSEEYDDPGEADLYEELKRKYENI